MPPLPTPTLAATPVSVRSALNQVSVLASPFSRVTFSEPMNFVV